MIYGMPYTEEERKARHLQIYGTLDNFPQKITEEPDNTKSDFFIFFIGTMMAQMISYAIMKWLNRKK